MPAEEVLEAVEPYERMYETQQKPDSMSPEESRPHVRELERDPLDRYIQQGDLEADCGG